MAEPEHAEPAPPEGGLRASAVAQALAVLWGRLGIGLRDPATVLPLVVIGGFVARFAWLDVPHGSLIFDEAYYVQAARTLLGWAVPAGAHYAGSPPGIDPNTEHPPLGKLLMAASMLVLGDNGYGWRLPSLIAGMIALWAVYKIVRTGGESAWFGTLVVGLLGLENLTLVHGRIATLDMLALAPVLVGSWLAMRGRWALAGVVVAIGLLIKLTAVYAVGAILLLFVLDEAGGWLRRRHLPIRTLRGPAVFVGVTAVLWIVGLAALDARFSSYTSVIDHVRHMLDYGTALAGSVAQTQHCPGTESYPWQWIFNDCQIPYLRVDVSVSVGDQLVSSRPSIDFRGAMNPILAGLIPLSAMFAAWYAWRADSRIARWAVAWGAANYVPYLILAATTRRVMYLYYMVPVVPAIAVAIALLLLRSGLPRPVRWAFVAAYVVGFLAYYPFRQVP